MVRLDGCRAHTVFLMEIVDVVGLLPAEPVDRTEEACPSGDLGARKMCKGAVESPI